MNTHTLTRYHRKAHRHQHCGIDFQRSAWVSLSLSTSPHLSNSCLPSLQPLLSIPSSQKIEVQLIPSVIEEVSCDFQLHISFVPHCVSRREAELRCRVIRPRMGSYRLGTFICFISLSVASILFILLVFDILGLWL